MQNQKGKNNSGKYLIPEMTDLGLTFFFKSNLTYFYFYIIFVAAAEHTYGNFHLKE